MLHLCGSPRLYSQAVVFSFDYIFGSNDSLMSVILTLSNPVRLKHEESDQSSFSLNYSSDATFALTRAGEATVLNVTPDPDLSIWIKPEYRR